MQAKNSFLSLSPEALNPVRLFNFLFKATVFCLVVSTIVLLACIVVADPDLWGHVRFGQDILNTGGLSLRDPYSYLTAGIDWIDHEWLAELLMGACYNFAGTYGLICLKAALVFTTCLIMFLSIISSGCGFLGSSLLFLALAGLAHNGVLVVRPHLFTDLFFALICLLLKKAGPQVRWTVWLLPVVFVFWVNTHGGYLLGLFIISFWLFGEIAQAVMYPHFRPKIKLKCLLISMCFIATLINPYGWKLSAFLLRTATIPRPEITDWQPFSVQGWQGMLYIFIVGITICSSCLSKKEKRFSEIGIVCFMLIAPLIACRHLALLAIAEAVFASQYIQEFFDDVYGKFAKRLNALVPLSAEKLWQFGRVIILLVCELATAFFICFIVQYSGKIHAKEGLKLPITAISFIKKLKIRGNLVTFFDWGEYIIWHLSPDVKISVDGRRETVYPENIYKENLSFIYGTGDWDALLQKHHTDMVLVCKDYPSFNLMKLEPGWKCVCEDKYSALFLPLKSQYLPAAQQSVNNILPLSLTQTTFP